LAAIANPIVAVGAMAGTLAGAMVHNGVAVDGRGARFAVTGAPVRLWGRASHLVRVTSAGLTAQHLVIAVLVVALAVAVCILGTCVPCMPDGSNNHLQHFQQKCEAVLRRIMRKNKQLQRIQRFILSWSRCNSLDIRSLSSPPDGLIRGSLETPPSSGPQSFCNVRFAY